jgi:hypothetical protein
VGIMDGPVDAIVSISERREERRRVQEARISGAWGRRSWDFMCAKRAGRGSVVPEREAKTEEMSPSFRGPEFFKGWDWGWDWAAVARVRESWSLWVALRGVTPRLVRNAESMLERFEWRCAVRKLIGREGEWRHTYTIRQRSMMKCAEESFAAIVVVWS